MNEKMNKIACKAIGYFTRILLDLFALIFGSTGIAALVTAVIDKDLFGFIGFAACTCVAYVCWSIRRSINVEI